MKKNLKRMAAALIAATTMAAGMSSLSVSAAVIESKDWYARDINTPGSPSSIDTVATVNLTASAFTYVGVCTDMTVTSNRKTTIWCSTHQMQDNGQDVWSFEINTPDCPVDWTIVNKDRIVTYRVSCTTNSANVLESWGTISIYS